MFSRAASIESDLSRQASVWTTLPPSLGVTALVIEDAFLALERLDAAQHAPRGPG